MGLHPSVLTYDIELIEKILSSPDLLNKAKTFYAPIFDVLQGGILSSPGIINFRFLRKKKKTFFLGCEFKIYFFFLAPTWQHCRKMINPSFSHKVLVSFLPVFHKGKTFLLSKLNEMADNGEYHLNDLIQRTSLGMSVGKLPKIC